MQLSTLAKRAWLLLFIAIAAFYLWGLGLFPLVGPDEPRYAQVAREMLQRRDFVTPTLGGLPWFEKPPLLYWLMMLSYRVFGVTEYAARLGPAVCGLVTGLFVYWIGKTTSRDSVLEAADHSGDGANIGRWSALVWFASLGALGFSRGATFDIVLTMTMTGALACFFVSENHDSGKRWNWILIAFYFCVALSLLAKGLIGLVLIFGIIALYFIMRREWPRRAFLLSPIWGLPFSLAVASIWYGPMMARHGWKFIDQFIIQHHFARFISNKYHHPAPFYFYIPVLIGLAVPWTMVLGDSLLSARRWHWRRPTMLDRADVLALAWLVVPVVFFSFSGSKLASYILPALPAAAILAGGRIAGFNGGHTGRSVLRATGAFLMIVAAVAVWYTHRYSDLRFATAALIALPLILTGLLALFLPQLGRQLFVLIALTAFVTSGLGLRFAGPMVARRQSVRDLLAVAAAHGYANTPVAQVNTIERSAEFYAAGRITYGSDGEPVNLESIAQMLEAARLGGGTVLCLVPLTDASQVTNARQIDAQIISDNGDVALLVVRPK